MSERGMKGAVAVLATVAIVACGGAPDAERKEDSGAPMESTTVGVVRATARLRVLIIGTSLTAGLGLDPDSAYPAVIQRLADSAGFRVTVVAAGVSGETSAGALRRVEWLMQERADVVVIETGANDGLRGLDPGATRTNIIGIIRAVRASNPEVRLLLAQMEAPTNLGANYTRDFHDGFLNVAREEEVALIPFFLEGVAGVPELNQPDGIHPNEEGARRAARNMWRALAAVLRDTPGAAAP